jgi:hypothetical protein
MCLQNVKQPLEREVPLPSWKANLQKLGLMTDIYYWHEKLRAESATIDSLKKEHYSAVKVFVVFEHEDDQVQYNSTSSPPLL